MKSCEYCNGTGKVKKYISGRLIDKYCDYCYGDGVAGGGTNDVLILLAVSVLFVVCATVGGLLSGIISLR